MYKCFMKSKNFIFFFVFFIISKHVFLVLLGDYLYTKKNMASLFIFLKSVFTD